MIASRYLVFGLVTFALPVWLFLSPGPKCPSATFAATKPAGELIALRNTIRYDGGKPYHDSVAALRDHGWALFKAITGQPAGCADPNWLRWPDKATTFRQDVSSHSTPDMRMRLEAVSEFTLALKQDPDPKPDLPVTFEAVAFNQVAHDHIRRERLFDRAGVDRLLKTGGPQIMEFPRGSVIVKSFWRRIPPTGSLRIGLWDWSNNPKTGKKVPEKDWTRHVCVSAPASAPDSQCQDKDIPVSTNTFYSVELKKTDQYVCPGCGQPAIGERLVLIGMHIITKETPDWVWVTLWWKGVDRQGCKSEPCDYAVTDNAQQSKDLAVPWRNYSMDATLGLFDGEEFRLRAIFNPFIEGALFSTGANCLQCHSQARVGWVVRPFPTFFNKTPDVGEFEGYVRTDYLWSVANELRESSHPSN
jgi:hypothetical protein